MRTVLAVVVTLLALAACDENVSPPGSVVTVPMYVRCEGVGAGVSCSVENRGDRTSSTCWDAVAECADGTHRAHGCSGDVPAHATESYALPAFLPTLSASAQPCRTFRVEEKPH